LVNLIQRPSTYFVIFPPFFYHLCNSTSYEHCYFSSVSTYQCLVWCSCQYFVVFIYTFIKDEIVLLDFKRDQIMLMCIIWFLWLPPSTPDASWL